MMSGLSGLIAITALAADPMSDATSDTIDVVALCGEDALTLATEIVTLPGDQAAKLDALLAQMVTAEGAAEVGVPPAPGLALRVETLSGAENSAAPG